MAPENRVLYRRLCAGDPVPEDFDPGEAFKVVLVLEQEAPPEWRASISRWLVARGCLYAMAWGIDCSEWHDEIDWANIEANPGGEIPEGKFIMTTWHDDELLGEVLWFSVYCARHPSVELQQTLILHVSATDRSDELTNMLREPK